MLTAVAMFDDLLEANRRYRAEVHDSGVQGRAAKGLAPGSQRTPALISSCALLPPGLQVGGFIFDVHGGERVPVES